MTFVLVTAVVILAFVYGYTQPAWVATALSYVKL